MSDTQILNDLLHTAHTRLLNDEELEKLNSVNGGFAEFIGLTFERVGPAEARARLTVSPQHHQPWGVANGGLYCTIAETVASIASVAAADAPAMGVNNSTDFIKATAKGELEAVATPIQLGKRTHVWNVDIRQDNTLIARTTLRTMILSEHNRG
ncbi:hotdog fold thioesterase [Corynebacterium macginleyi]|uniref:PaaI family thioesterase n=1 Tax=Corynebacterium macginleyi TaxID=38290 RepID=A0ABS1Y661_9CORY|nr:PaaI family thioesterase [Corynebacterium macginleyi]MBK4140904.1 hotdog fold thioesterase [Corynebacterium macginleyi]MBK4143211.1 hotdog fold thioesterase [Corynebacterium macginleyi]MBK4148625.1 hotdog fold thioesterase [Corynebacterium macginleyi]MBK4150210.1 hotdog fold thioesterase [Corynebacterium macginleyi]MBK4152552.1 hotdog fold thioesterase [Corynebacterium macginleyi]